MIITTTKSFLNHSLQNCTSLVCISECNTKPNTKYTDFYSDLIWANCDAFNAWANRQLDLLWTMQTSTARHAP